MHYRVSIVIGALALVLSSMGVCALSPMPASAEDGTPRDGLSRALAQAEGQQRATGKPADKPGAGRAQPIEVTDCTIKLLDEVTLASDRPGIVAFIKPREGESVHQGELVAWLKDEVAQATLAVAAKEAESDIDIRYAEKAAEVAQAEHDKAIEANKIQAKAIPEIEVLRLKLAAERARLELESARHRREVAILKRDEAQAQLDTFRIVAPFDGVVTRVHRSKGEAVRQGDQVLEMVSTRRVRVDGLVGIRDVWNVRPGAEVTVRLDLPDVDLEVEKQAFRGKIMAVDVKAEPVTQQVRVWAEIDNPANLLRAGLKARMTIDVGRNVAPGQ